MSAAIWASAFVIVGGLGAALMATYDQVERDRAANDRCRCPQHDAGGTCER